MSFEYFKAGEEEQYLFFRFPWTLLRDPKYKWSISMHAKVLYGCMLDRLRLSRKNDWIDEDGNIFIYYTLDDICYDVEVSEKTASVLLNELEGVELIFRVRQGLGKPNRLYVGKFFKSDPYDVRIQNRKDYGSGTVKDTDADASNLQGIKNKHKKTKKKKTIHSSQGSGGEGRDVDKLIAYLDEQCAFEVLKLDDPHRSTDIDGIRDLIIEVCTSTAKTIRINGEDKPAKVVKSRFMKLNTEHIRFCLDCLKENTSKIRKIRAYLLTVLFNAPTTIDHYYTALVNYDMAHPELFEHD